MLDTIRRFNDSLALLSVLLIIGLFGADAAFNGFTLSETVTGALITWGGLIYIFYFRKSPPKTE